MKWQTLSGPALALLQRLRDESKLPRGRSGKMTRSLHALTALGEPSAIPEIVDYLVDDDPSVAQETVAAMEALYTGMSPELLPTLDGAIRRGTYWNDPGGRWRQQGASSIERIPKDPTHSLALGLASCHSSGYVRQPAVSRLDREIMTGAEIPFLLLRLDDWVPAVRRAAERAIERRLTDSHHAAYLQNLALVARLRRRLRASDSPALVRIETLFRSDPIALVNAALALEDRVDLRYGVSLALAS